jgi:hypothetical protein
VVAIATQDDGAHIKAWLLTCPFIPAVHLTIVSVVRAIPTTNPFDIFPVQGLTNAALRTAKDMVASLAEELAVLHYRVDRQVTVGDRSAS